MRSSIREEHVEFLKLICSEMTYKEIANKMGKTEKKCMNYTQFLCNKFNVRSRLGLMLYSIKNKIVKPNEIKFKKLGGPSLLKGFSVALGGTVLLEGKSALLSKDEEKSRKTYERNVQKRLSHY